jgi:hypothetical protein
MILDQNAAICGEICEPGRLKFVARVIRVELRDSRARAYVRGRIAA